MKNIRQYFKLWFWRAACYFEIKRQGITYWHCTPKKDVKSMTLEEKIDFYRCMHHIFADDGTDSVEDKEFF